MARSITGFRRHSRLIGTAVVLGGLSLGGIATASAGIVGVTVGSAMSVMWGLAVASAAGTMIFWHLLLREPEVHGGVTR